MVAPVLCPHHYRLLTRGLLDRARPWHTHHTPLPCRFLVEGMDGEEVVLTWTMELQDTLQSQ